MREKQTFHEKPLAFRVATADLESLEATAKRLDLDRSEILRRALHVGLEIFENVDLPGGAEAD